MSLGQLKSAPSSRIANYEVIRQLSSGVLTDVFEALEEGTQERVAIKRLKKEQYEFPQVVKRFQREAMAAASLHHPHIVPVYNVGSHLGQHFYVMKFIQGMNLNGLRRLIHDGVDNPSAPRVRIRQMFNHSDSIVELACQVLDAIQYGHSLGVIHRDIRPSNILIDFQGRPWVTDFGSVKLTQFISEELSTSGHMMKHCRYSPPELILADSEGMEDPRSDIFSAGLVFFELLTGKISSLSAARISDLPIEFPKTLESVIRQACDKDRNHRFQSAEAFAHELRNHRERSKLPNKVKSFLRNVKKQILDD